jgi:hypothetical protein
MPNPRKARRHDLFIYNTALKCGDAFVAFFKAPLHDRKKGTAPLHDYKNTLHKGEIIR